MSPSENLSAKPQWSLWRAALYGLLIQIIVLVISGLADGGKDFFLWLHARPSEMVTHFVGELLAGPLIFVAIARIRNWRVRKSN